MRFLIFGLLFLSAVYFSDSKSIAKRDAQTDALLKTVSDLLTKASAAVEKLQKEGKTALVAGLQASIKFLTEVDTQLKTLKPTTELGKSLLEGLEQLVKQGEAVLEEDLKKAQSGKVKRDTKTDALLKTVTDLLAKASAAVDKLEKEGKTALVAGLQASIKFLTDVDTQLKTLKPTTELGKSLLEGLEQLVKQGEAVLEEDLKKAQAGRVKRDARTDALLKTVADLLTKASAAVDKLEKEGKTALVAGLQASIKFLTDVDTQLKTLKPTTEIGKQLLEGLEQLVKQGAAVLEEDLKKAQSGKVKRDTKTDALLKTVTDLLAKASAAVDKLEKEGKTALVAGLQASIKFLTDVDTQLRNLKPTTELGKSLLEGLEQLVKQGEAVLEEDLKKAQAGRVKRDARTDALLKTVADLLTKASAAVEKLEKEGKTALVAGLQASIKFLTDVDTQLKTLKPTTEIGKQLLEGLEQLVKQGAAVLEEDLKKAQSGKVKRDTKTDALLKTVSDLLTKASAAVDKLEKEGKTALVAGLQASIKFLTEVDTQLRNLKPTTELGKSLLEGLEQLVKQGEAVLEEDLKKAQAGRVKRDARTDALLKTVADLLTKASAAVEKLEKEGKTALVTGLQASIKFLTDVDTQLKTLKPTTEIGKQLLEGLEQLVKQGAAVLEEDLKKAQAGF